MRRVLSLRHGVPCFGRGILSHGMLGAGCWLGIATGAVAQSQPPPASAPAIAPAAKAPRRDIAENLRVEAVRRPDAAGGLLRRQTEDKAVGTVDQAFIATQAPIQNADQYVRLLPGALVQNSDPFGLSQQFSLEVHGLGPDEIGYTLEGMPLNDIGYYSAYPSQAIDSENIDQISLAPGTADLDSPVISEAGGLMKISMVDPTLHSGGSIDASVGSLDTDREFIRLDTGLLGASGLRAFVSYSHTDSEQWRGSGRVKRQHIDFKLVHEWGDGNRVAWSGEWHDAVTPAYQNPTLASYRSEGPNGVDNNYAATFTPGGTDDWKDYDQTFRVFYTSMPTRLALASRLALDVTPYAQYGFGNSPFEDVLDPTAVYTGAAGPFATAIPNAAATGGSVMANVLDRQYRAGVIAKLTWTVGANRVVFGDWYDYSDEADIQSYSALGPQGVPADIWGDDVRQQLRLASGPMAGQLLLDDRDVVITQNDELFVADALMLLDGRLTIEAGLKYATTARDGVNEVPGPQYRATIDDNEPLPRAGVRYRIDAAQMVFASVSTDFRSPSEQTFFNQYDQGGLSYSANLDLKPEYSISETLGYRYNGERLIGSISAFNYDFTNRQISTLGGPSGLENLSVNAGGQTSRGIDAEAGTQPWSHLSPYASVEYLHATIDNDIEDGTDFARTAGRTATSSPEFQAAIGLHYDDGTVFGQFDVKYVGKQYTTFVNDESIPASATPDLSIGYRLPKAGLPHRAELQLNFINIGSPFLSGVAAPTIAARNTLGRYGTPIAGVAPTYFVSSGLAVLFTAKQAF